MYMNFDDFEVQTGICPLSPSTLFTVTPNIVTLSTANPVSPALGSYAVFQGTGAGFIALTVTPDFASLFPAGFSQLTVSVWVKVLSRPASGAEVSILADASTQLPFLRLDIYPNNDTAPVFGLPPGTSGFQKDGFDVGQSCLSFPNQLCDSSIRIGTWHHLVGTYDSSGLMIYVDGQPLGIFVGLAGTPTLTGGSFLIGSDTVNSLLHAAIDELRIYDTALAADQVLDLYTSSRTLHAPSNITISPTPPANIALRSVGQVENLTAIATSANASSISYFWEDATTGCTILNFDTPTLASPGLSLFALGNANVLVGGLNSDELCKSYSYSFSVNGTSATLRSQPQNASQVYLNEYTEVVVDVDGFPTPIFQWEISITRTVLLPNGTVAQQIFYVPIPGQVKPRLSLLNKNGTFAGVPTSSRRRALGDIVVRCAYKNTYTAQQFTPTITVTPLTIPRPTPSNSSGDGDGDGGIVAAIVVPVVVGPILLCLLCLLCLLVVVLIIFARRKGGGEWKPDLSEPDYESLAFGKFLDDPPSVSKKQLTALKKLEELLLNSDYLLTRLLCDNAKATEADNVAKVVTYLYAAHGEAVGLVQYFITKEVESSNKEGTLFRANSISSKMFTTYSRVIALKYVWKIFAYPVAELDHMAQVATGETSGEGGSKTTIMGPMAMEVDPSKMEEAADEQINTLELWLVAQKLFSGMNKAKSSVPSEIRLLLRHVQTEVAGKFSEQAAHKAMGGFLFLRLLCPSLMAPQVYGLLKEPPNAMAQRQLILIAKVMQNLANDTLPGKKEGYMERLNEFITSNQDRLRSFYAELIAHAEDGPQEQPSVPNSVKTNSLIQLHKYISVNYDKLSAVIQQEDEGLAAELQEVMDSIGNIDTEEL